MQIDWTAYGLAVMFARRQRQMTQAELADWIGVCRVSLSYIERGRANPRQRTTDAIASLLAVYVASYRKREL